MVEDITDEMMIALEAQERRFDLENRKALLNGLCLLLEHPLDEQINIACGDNLVELLDILNDMSKVDYKYIDSETLEDLRIIRSILSELQNKVLVAIRSTVKDAIDKIEEALKSNNIYPPYSPIEPRNYYKYYPGYEYGKYPYYQYGKYEHYEKAKRLAENLAREYNLESRNLNNPSIWDYIAIDLATGKIGNRKLEDLMKEKPGESEIILSAIKEIEEQIREKKNKQYDELSSKVMELEEEKKQREKELSDFRWVIIDKWLKQESERMKE